MSSPSALRKEIQELKDKMIKPELPVNCTKTQSKKDGNVVGIAFAIGFSILFIITLLYIKPEDRIYSDVYDSNRVIRRYTTQRALINAGIVLLLGAIGGCIYYLVVEEPKVIAKKNKESWPIKESHNDKCKLFFNHKYDDVPVTLVKNSNKTPIVFPANMAIRKIKIEFSSLESTAVLTVRDKDKSVVLENSFSPIIRGYQCIFDVLITSDKYTIDLVTNDTESVVTYMAGAIPENLVEYVTTYNIVGRQCPSYTLVVAENDKKELEFKKIDTFC